MMDEVLGTPAIMEDLSNGKTVIFKAGHAFAGLIGRVIQAKDGKADVMVGSSLRVGIPVGDLLLAPEVDLGKPGYKG